MSDLRERVARAIERAQDYTHGATYMAMADAVLAELALTQAEPVAWMTPGGDVSRSYAWAAERCAETEPMPLYTVPQPQPQAEPVGDLVEKLADFEALTAQCSDVIARQMKCIAELTRARDAAQSVLLSGNMRRVLRFVMNHAGKGLHGSLQFQADWIESKIGDIEAAIDREKTHE